ncbi:MAG TPA: hypothetical protein PLZ77_10665, partial [Lachnospiraceae bacterium]|nr:hypothetical protein [Lachnospiraceae bacterium]
MKEKLKNIWEQYSNKDKKLKKTYKIITVGLVIVLIVIITVIAILCNKKSNTANKDIIVTQKTQKAGVTETGSIEVGTTIQSFKLDISEFTGETSYTVTNNAMQGNSMNAGFPGGMSSIQTQSTTSVSSSSDTRQLEIEEVYVEAGQEIKVGEPILKLTEETVNSIRTELSEDVTSAKLVYDQALTASQQTDVEADSDYKINSLYGTYSQSEYEQTVKALQETVSDKEEALTQAQETLAKEQEELAEKETLLSEEETVLKNAQYTADGTDREENLYWWIVAWETKEDAETLVETLTEEIEQLKEDIEKDSQAVTDAQTELSLAQEALEAGIIEAENELTLRTFYADNAQEIYDVATLQSAFSEEVAKQDYEDAQQKLEDFDTSIENNVIYA